MTTKDQVLAQLRNDKIKLWLPPYRNLPTQGGGANSEALRKLADSLQKKGATGQDENNSSIGNNSPTTAKEVLIILEELQNHAVQKLKEKNSVGIKILASKKHFEGLHKGDDGTIAPDVFSTASWGEEVTISSQDAKTLHLRLANLSPTLTVHALSNDLCRALNARTVRVIWKGKNLLSSDNGGGDTLRKIITANDSGAGGMAASQKKKSELLCLVSGYGYVPPTPAVASAAAAAAASSATDIAPARTEASIIESIRHASNTLQSSSRGSRFEVTDQNGNLVPMRQSDTAAFLTALGLHRIGRSKMEKQRDFLSTSDSIISVELADATTTTTTTTANDGDGSGSIDRDAVASALVFLLEADAEWNTSTALDMFRTKVDNYGLLQMDIAWCYLLLESLDDLADAVRRLDVAERVLRKQVHSNFVTLAVAQAEMEHPIPPLCSIFVRLFLLQGVANKLQNNICNNAAAKERMGWAQLLCNKLRSSSPPDTVSAICNAYFVDPSTAVAALRRSNGDPDAAGNFIASDRDDERTAAKKRRRQRRMGMCENKTDYVDLTLVQALADMLGYDVVASDMKNIDEREEEDNNEDGNASEDDLHTSTLIVIGLLRLSNNDINESLELSNTIGAAEVLERVKLLDEASGRRKRRSTKGKPPEHQVNDIDLTMLVSMGVEENKGRDALKATGNVESALLWLSKDYDAKTEDETGKEASAPANGENNNTNNSSAAPRNLSGSDDDEDKSTSDSEGNDEDISNAQELLERELGNVLGTGASSSKQLLEKEWLGVDLQDEWDLIQRYI